MTPTHRIWVGKMGDDFSGFTFYLVPDVPEDAWKQAENILAAMPDYDVCELFRTPLDDKPIYRAERISPRGEIIRGGFVALLDSTAGSRQ